MSRATTTTGSRRTWGVPSAQTDASWLGLVIAWSRDQPDRVGQSAWVRGSERRVLGRGPALPSDPHPRLTFAVDRPGSLFTAKPPAEAQPAWLEGARISREQLRVRAVEDAIEVERTGRCPMFIRGQTATFARVTAGDTIMLEDELVLLVVERSLAEDNYPNVTEEFDTPFGEPDRFGIVGESAAAWTLRDRLAFVAPRPVHVVLFGASGVGKELAARAIHELSGRRSGPLVSRNAATLPSGVIDAELFGNAKNYPQAGMSERPGLIGQAHGGSLFLDEIAELPEDLQAHLLRVLDEGEYQRLGESTMRRSDLRLIAATNREPGALKHDVFARLKLQVNVPGLEERKQDIPLLVRHLLSRAASSDPKLLARFAETKDGVTRFRVDPTLVEGLLRHRFTLHVRELESLLWTAMAGSRNDYVALTDEVASRLDLAQKPAAQEPTEITKEQIEEALEKHQGNQMRAFRDLGLRSRDQLYRLMKKHGVTAKK